MKRMDGRKILAGVMALALLAGTIAAGYRQRTKGEPAWVLARLEGRQIVLDAGHGGEDGGAVSVTGEAESGINLAVTLKLDQLMGFCGMAPVLLRETDISLYDEGCSTLREKKVSDLHNRVAMIEEIPNAVLVSIHQNTYADPAYHGAQVFFRTGAESEALAGIVQDSLRALDPENKRKPAKIPDSVYLMKHISCPAVLVECGFLSNAKEEALLRDKGYQIKLALCVTAAVLRGGEVGGGETGKTVI